MRRRPGVWRAVAVLALALLLGAGAGCAGSGSGDGALFAADHNESGESAAARRSLQKRIDALHADGLAAMETGELARAEAHFRLMLQLDPGNPDALYGLAGTHARRDDRADSVRWLAKAIAAGHVNADRIRRDEHLAALRGYGPFESLLAQIDEFVDQLAAKRVQALRSQLGPGYLYHVDRDNRLIVATNQSRGMLESLIERLTEFADAQWATLLIYKPQDYVTIVLPHRKDFRRFVPDPQIGGFYHPDRKLLIAQDPGYTLIHEFMHALHFADLEQRDVKLNIWFLEAVATLFENSVVRDGKPVPLPNNRGMLLRELAASGDLVPWRELMTMPADVYMRSAPAHYAQSRSIALWLHERGRLRSFYEHYCRTAGGDSSGIRALEATFDRPMTTLEQEWREWLAARPSPVEVRDATPWLGVLLSGVRDGLAVVGTWRDGPADLAGVKPDDVILELDGVRTLSADAIGGALVGHAAGDTVPMRVLRDGRTLGLRLVLAERPPR